MFFLREVEAIDLCETEFVLECCTNVLDSDMEHKMILERLFLIIPHNLR